MGDSLAIIELGTGRTAKAIATGGSHTCAILDNSSVKCWGSNTAGQLGLGNTNNIGDSSGEMGDSLAIVDLGNGRTAKAIATGDSHTCAILDNSHIKCWGRSNEGQLALVGGKAGSGFQKGDSADEMGDDLDAIELGTGRTATAIAAGKFHNCAILDNSSIKCWGSNTAGQLGLGDASNRGDGNGNDIDMGDNFPVVELGAGRTARGITAGDNQTCAILDNSSIKCWGSNTSGQLGLGDTSNRGDGSGEMGDNLPVISF
jgi:E3 ubiquitin-protein ligase HERC3